MKYLNALALLLTILVNYGSTAGWFDHNTMAIQSARHPSLFTPAPWAFSIWGLIYLALLAFVIYNIRTGEDRRIGPWFLISCIANSGWVIAWMYDQTILSVVIMITLLLSLLKIILLTDMELTDPPLKTIAFIWWPFCLYLGWITVATLANIAAVLGIQSESTTILLIAIACAAYLTLTWKRNMRESGFVGVWALIAVGKANEHRAPVVTTIAYIAAGIIFLSSSIHGYRNRAYSPFRRRI
ncbi:MAG: tryptophan-rich sensory protein [Bacteroidetes bacterium]|nr:tryptophan-rich sensory protein [Bacteroidota bacterium]